MTYNFDLSIDRKGTYCTQWDYIEDRFGKKDLLPFSVSDTDFSVPEEITKALEERLKHPVFGYTRWNHQTFKGAIADWYQKRFQANIQSEWVLYSPSVIYSIAKLIELKSNQGDHVVLQTPAYDAFFKTIQDNHRTLIENKLLFNDGHYTIDFNDLEAKLAHPKAKIFLLCSPHNPTGRVWTKNELSKILQLCQKHHVFIISDDIHMDILRESQKHIPLTECALELKEIAICSSASKTFNTPGLICSYLIVPDKALREAFLITLKNRDGLSSTSIFGMISTIVAYKECEAWVVELNQYLTENFTILEQFLAAELPNLRLISSEATYLAWIDISAIPHSSDDIQHALIQKGKVAIMPGETYGSNGSTFLRMNLGCPKEKLIEGLKRLKIGINALQIKEEFSC